MTDNEQLERTRKALDKISSNLGSLYKAHCFVQEGKFERALESCLQGLQGRIGSRLPDLNLKDTVEKLIKEYPPARDEFEKRREEFEADIQKGRHSRMLHEEWMVINNALGDNNHEVEFLKHLKDATSDSRHRTEFISYQTIKFNLPNYLADRRYDVIEPYLYQLGTMFLGRYMNYETQKYFTEDKRYLSEQMNMDIEEVLNDGPMLYEACLGLQRIPAADEIARKVLAVSSSRKTFSAFLKAAQRVGNKEQVKALLKAAKKLLPLKSFEGLKREVK